MTVLLYASVVCKCCLIYCLYGANKVTDWLVENRKCIVSIITWFQTTQSRENNIYHQLLELSSNIYPAHEARWAIIFTTIWAFKLVDIDGILLLYLTMMWVNDVLHLSHVGCFDGQIVRHAAAAAVITGSSVHLLITRCLNVPAMHVVREFNVWRSGPGTPSSSRLPTACYRASPAEKLICRAPIAFPLTQLHIYSWICSTSGLESERLEPDDIRLARSEDCPMFGVVPDFYRWPEEWGPCVKCSSSFCVFVRPSQ